MEEHKAESTKELEKSLDEQVQNETYDFKSNKMLLKLYLLHPTTAKAEKVALILIKAMMNLPNPDFSILTHIIPDSIQLNEPVQEIILAWNALEIAKFDEFWKIVNGNALMKNDNMVKGFLTSVRCFIIKLMSYSCQQAPVEIICKALDLSTPKQVNDFLDANMKDVAIVDVHNNVLFSNSGQNHFQAMKFKENIEFDNMVNVIQKLGAAI